MVAGRRVGGRRAVRECVRRAVAVGGIEVDEVVVDECVVAAVEVEVETREEQVLLLEAAGSRIRIRLQERDRAWCTASL